MADELQDLGRLIEDVVRPAIHPQRMPLDVAAWHLAGEPRPAVEAIRAEFTPFSVGEWWGGRWSTTWFRLRASLPAAWAGAEVEALVDLGGDAAVGFCAEGLVWDRMGTPVQGLHHRQHRLGVAERADPGQTVELYVEAASNPVPTRATSTSKGGEGSLLEPDYGGGPLYQLRQAELAAVDRQVEALYHDLRLLWQLAFQGTAPQGAVLQTLLEAGAELGLDPGGVAEAAPRARARLRPVLETRSTSPTTVVAVGHAHIDSAWLWPAREAKRKCARTFANQLRLLERYPEHHFVCSQAVQYQWIKDDYPALYQQIRGRVADGRWEPVGGMWVEPDTNVPSGESLVRQIVVGARFFADELGVESHELWIPDAFGYSAALPQIAAQAGITALVTQKLSWNDTNVFPHSTFCWEGHDGSRVLTHFPPADTYNGDLSVAELDRAERNVKDPDRSRLVLYPFGFGDGGGGPTAEMLETARRGGDLAGLPKVELGTVDGFFERVRGERESSAGDLETWVGELYLETHRGTFTTHADMKLGNRRGEEALRAAELWSVAAGSDHRGELDAAWRRLLFNQFHDILPGSGIHWVHEDAARDHVSVLATAETVMGQAQRALVGPGEGFVAFNPSSYDRDEVAELPDGQLALVGVPGCGWAPVPVEGPKGVAEPVEVSDRVLENGILRVEWDDHGLLTSVWDKEHGRQVLAPGGRGNLLQLHHDHPQAFDAWNLDRDYLDAVEDLEGVESIERFESHPLRASVRVVRRFGSSTITQVMRLAVGSRRLEFHTEVDWQERHRMLKAAFPVAIRSTRATYEIQHGHLERPTVANTSWDQARFEVCGHRWADLSEPGYGVALLNDCKYGYDIRGHVLRLSLLRGPVYPDPLADRGPHRFAYALLPHPGDLRHEGNVVAEAEWFNLGLSFVEGTADAGQLVAVDRPGVSVEAAKWADRTEGVVVRLCEVWGARRPVRVRLNRPFETVARTDLLERDLEVLAHEGSTVELSLRPFELVTLRFS